MGFSLIDTMIPPQTLISIGLFVDAIGALGIAIPDLPDRIRFRIRENIPWIRKYHIAHQKLGSFNRRWPSNHPDPRDEIRPVWPAVRWVYDLPEYDDIQFDEVYDRSLLVQDESGDRLADIEIVDLTAEVRNRLDARFRVIGWVLLFLGFIIQLAGTLI